MDLAVISKCEINWETVKKHIEELEIQKFAHACFYLIEKWFDIKLPIKEATFAKDFYDVATNAIFSNGVFGFDDENNNDNYQLSLIRRDGAFHIFTKHVFPKYEYMVKINSYSFLRNKKWLLPFAWLYRIFLKIKGKNVKSSIEIAFSPYTKRAELGSREAYLKQWGL